MLDFLKRKKKAEQPKPVKRGFFRELANDILFALMAVTLIRMFFVEAYAIPTGSMENSMLIGDHLFVSKFHYGARTPKTLINFPLAHQTFWGIKVGGKEIPSYTDIIQAPSFRLPGLRSPEVGDPVVFNYPPDYELGFPVDLKTFYVKRCLATPGDVFEVRNKKIYVNDILVEDPPNSLTSFFVEADKPINSSFMTRLGITDYTDENPADTYSTVAYPYYTYKGKQGFYIHTTRAKAEKMQGYNFITSVEEVIYPKGEAGTFPSSPLFDWSRDFFGPLTMPKEGQTIPLTPENVALYGIAIQHYEGNENVEIQGDEIFMDGIKLESYTFTQGYYFMIGDNRHNSLDSRSWGFVPEDHIVGKPLFIFFSTDRTNPNGSFFENIRFDRVLDIIK